MDLSRAVITSAFVSELDTISTFSDWESTPHFQRGYQNNNHRHKTSGEMGATHLLSLLLNHLLVEIMTHKFLDRFIIRSQQYISGAKFCILELRISLHTANPLAVFQTALMEVQCRLRESKIFFAADRIPLFQIVERIAGA